MDCNYCKKPITLVPSALERAKRYGGSPDDYTKLFTIHANCQIKKRNQDVFDLIRRKQDE